MSLYVEDYTNSIDNVDEKKFEVDFYQWEDLCELGVMSKFDATDLSYIDCITYCSGLKSIVDRFDRRCTNLTAKRRCTYETTKRTREYNAINLWKLFQIVLARSKKPIANWIIKYLLESNDCVQEVLEKAIQHNFEIESEWRPHKAGSYPQSYQDAMRVLVLLAKTVNI